MWCARGIHIRTCSICRTCTDEAAAVHGPQTAGSKGRLYYSTYYLKCGFGYQLGVTRLQASQVQRDACIGTYLCIWIPVGRNALFKMFFLINKMVPSLGLNWSSNAVPVGSHEIKQTNDLDTREGVCCCSPFANRARQGLGLGPGPGPRTGRDRHVHSWSGPIPAASERNNPVYFELLFS